MANIYLSSTYGDLIECRNVVYKALRAMHHNVIAMEDYVAADERPLDRCLADVEASDLYIGIFAWRYGFIPQEANPEHKSITELEYRKAVETGKTALIFLLDPNAPWSMTTTDMFTGEGNGGKSIRALREEFSLQTQVSFFRNAEELAAKVSQAVSNWEKEHSGGKETLWQVLAQRKYLENVYERYSTVKLPIGPTEGFFLNAIFQPLTLRRDPLAAEDLEYKRRRLLLGESPSSKDHRDLQEINRFEKEHVSLENQGAPHTIAETGDEAVEKSPQKRVIILGGPGTGKTTTLKYLAGKRAQEALENPDLPLPIFFSLAAFARSEKSLQHYLVDVVEDMKVESSYAEVLWREIEAGNAFICLDSLDEVTPDLRPKMIELINLWASEKGNTWIVGSRFTEYKGGQFKKGQFTEWELLPMNSELRLELARRLLPQLQSLLPSKSEFSVSAKIFIHTLEKHPRAAAWGENPLLFSLAAVVFTKLGHLPSSRATLYREVIEAVLKMREPNPIKSRLLQRILAELALWLQQYRGRTFSMDDLVNFLLDVQRKSWGEVTDLVHHIISCGVMEIVARNTYGFRHQTFQEYLAATELARRLTSSDPKQHQETWDFMWSKRTYSRWTEILRLVVGVLTQAPITGGKTEAQRWLHALLSQRKTVEGDPGNLGLSLTLKSLTEISEIEEWNSLQTIEIEQEAISIWIEELITAARYQRYTKAKRMEALAYDVSLLNERAVNIAVNQLIPALKDRSRNVRTSVVKVLGSLGERLPLTDLFVLLEDQSRDARIAIIEVLGEQGERVPLDILIHSLEDKDEDVRYAAIKALGKQGERVPLDILIHSLEDEDEDVRYAAIEALGKQGERVPLAILTTLLENKDSEVRSAAIEALGEQGKRVPLEIFIHSLKDEDRDVRRTAVHALGKQGERVPLEILTQLLKNEDWVMCHTAVHALGEQGERVPLEILTQLLKDKNSNVRRAAVLALGKQGERVPLEIFTQLLEDEDLGVHRAVVEALGKQGERVLLSQILEVISSGKWKMRVAAVELLGKQGTQACLEILIKTFEDRSWHVRSSVIEALGKQGEQVPLNILIHSLEDEDSNVRCAAIEALGKQGEQVPLNILIHSLEDEDRDVHLAAVLALMKQGERVPLEVLTQLLKDKDPNVRRAVVKALGEQGERVPLEILTQLLEDEELRYAAIEALGKQGERVPLEIFFKLLENEELRSSTVFALGEQKERVPLEIFTQFLEDEDEDVRCTAIEALGKQGERVPLEIFTQLLEDEDKDVRCAAIEALGKQGERVPLDTFIQFLEEKDWYARFVAITALGKQGERVPLEFLIHSLEDEESNVRYAAIEALGKQEERVPLDILIAALYDENAGIREVTLQAINKRSDDIPPELLLPLIGDEDSDIRSITFDILNKRFPKLLAYPISEAISILQENTPGETFGSIAESNVADIIYNMGYSTPVLLDRLIPLLDWPYWPVQVKAVQAFGQLRRNIPNPVIKRLLAIRNNPNPLMHVLREAADDALAEILSLETSIEDD